MGNATAKGANNPASGYFVDKIVIMHLVSGLFDFLHPTEFVFEHFLFIFLMEA